MAFLPCCLFSIWVSFFPSPLQPCSSLLPVAAFGQGVPAARAGLCLAMEISLSWMPLPIPHWTHLLLPLRFFFLFTLCGVGSDKCHPSPFCLQLPPAVQCSGFIYSVGQAFIFIPCGLFLKQSSSTMLLMYPKVLQIFLFHFILEI